MPKDKWTIVQPQFDTGVQQRDNTWTVVPETTQHIQTPDERNKEISGYKPYVDPTNTKFNRIMQQTWNGAKIPFQMFGADPDLIKDNPKVGIPQALTSAITAELPLGVVGKNIINDAKIGAKQVGVGAKKALNNIRYETDVLANKLISERNKAVNNEIENATKWAQKWYTHPESINNFQPIKNSIEPFDLNLPKKIAKGSEKKQIEYLKNKGYESPKTILEYNRIYTNAYNKYKNVLNNTNKIKYKNLGRGVLGHNNLDNDYIVVNKYHPRFDSIKNVGTTTVHELTHGITAGDLGLGNTYNKIKNDFKPLNLTDRKDLYLTEPTEIHARINEMRYLADLKPNQMIDDNLTNILHEWGSKGDAGIDPRFFKLVSPEKLKKYLNPKFLPMATGAAVVGNQAIKKDKGFKNGGRVTWSIQE